MKFSGSPSARLTPLYSSVQINAEREYKLPSLSLIAKLNSAGIDNIKAFAVLKANGSISEDVILLYDELYLQQCDQYSGGKVEVFDANGNLYTGIVCFIIIGLKLSEPYIIKVKLSLRVPKVNLCCGWLKDELELTLNVIIEFGFSVSIVAT